MTNNGLYNENWYPKTETYTPSTEEVVEVHNELTAQLFPSLETLNEYPELEYSLKYEKGNTWPLIVVGGQDEVGKRLVWMITRNSISSSKILEYYLHQDGSVSLSDNPTDATDVKLFNNRIEGLKSGIRNAKKKGALSGEYLSEKVVDNK